MNVALGVLGGLINTLEWKVNDKEPNEDTKRLLVIKNVVYGGIAGFVFGPDAFSKIGVLTAIGMGSFGEFVVSSSWKAIKEKFIPTV